MAIMSGIHVAIKAKFLGVVICGFAYLIRDILHTYQSFRFFDPEFIFARFRQRMLACIAVVNSQPPQYDHDMSKVDQILDVSVPETGYRKNVPVLTMYLFWTHGLEWFYVAS